MKAIVAFSLILISSNTAFASDLSRALRQNFTETQVKQAEDLAVWIDSISNVSPESAGQVINSVSEDFRQIDLNEMADAAAELEIEFRNFLSDSSAPANEAITELSNFLLQSNN